ncbi:hypothetical protein SAMN05877838_3159 [Hoeflea halophila]|uniref:Uncharacterized protein n=1 Tax=Hoeflea halophila TaxID=714899 RepID=A0A286IFX1_9HYPH|nr:polyheme membrane-associated cytochrome C [Hoeflea halophila]SOE18239.1 hypothetical protein SAMN05877838_3159 [Hoeflea halophila]
MVFRFVFAATFVFALGFSAHTALAQDQNSQTLERLSRIVEAWRQSPHADFESQAFTHWNDEEARQVPGSCAVCHSGIGFNSYVTGDMSVAGILDHPTPLGNTVDCAACHGEGATNLTEVPFPSGVRLDGFETSAVCVVCHQGRAAGVTVQNATAGLEDDTVSEALSFINVHYSPSAGTQMGSVAGTGYQYEGRTYKGQFTHVSDFQQCTDCHRPHSLASVPIENCTACHQGAEAFSDIRISPADFDGDGDVSEGIGEPIKEMHGRLYAAIQSYARDVAGTAVIYADRYPHFFIDTDGDGAATEGEVAFPNRYASWTPRLLKAAYNYQFIAKDKAAYAHNPHYALQILYDTLEDLSGSVDVDMAKPTRP